MEVFANQPAVQEKTTERDMVPIEKLSEFWPRILGNLQASELSDSLVWGRQNVTGRIRKMCPTWRLKEELKWKKMKPLPVKC